MTDVPFSDALRVWGRIGVLSFGGPAAQIALMHREIVEERQWLSEERFINALNFCMLLPGPEAMQLATYAGWRTGGILGGLAAGLLFVLPGAFVILALGIIYATLGNVPLVEALFLGVKAAVLIIVIEALWKISKRALKRPGHWIIAALAFVAIFSLQLPYPLIVIAAALWGAFTIKDAPDPTPVPAISPSRTFATIALGLLIWAAPLALIWAAGGHDILFEIGAFFSKLAVVTFGGAYAVLAYMAQQVVTDFGWLEPGEMLDGLGLAETTPGPLILVTEFVGFLAGYRTGGIGLGIAAAGVTLWVTFVPCFLWIFAGAPYIDWIGTQPKLKGAMSAITAAVVGVILNLSIWFAIHVLFSKVDESHFGPARLLIPDLTSVDWRVLVIAVLSGLLLLGRHWSIIKVLGVAALCGLALSAI